MAGRYGRRFMRDEDFEEGDVWGTVMEQRENSHSIKKKSSSSSSFALSLSPSSGGSSKPRMIPNPRPSSNEAATHHHHKQQQQFSAPLDIPDWSKIYGKTTNTTHSPLSWVHHHHHHHHHHGDMDDDGDDDDDDDDDGEVEDEDGMVPPHEYLAKKLARSQISSFSVYEGIGRTLKGRDLSKLRNAILTKTGFLES